METTNTQSKSALMIVGLTFGGIFFTSIILIIPLRLMGIAILDIAAHHHFLMGFISLLVLMFCIKKYMSYYNVTNNRYNLRKMTGFKGKTKNSPNGKFRNYLEKRYGSQKSLINHKNKIADFVFSNKDNVKIRMEELQKLKEKSDTNNLNETTIWYEESSQVSMKSGIGSQTLGF